MGESLPITRKRASYKDARGTFMGESPGPAIDDDSELDGIKENWEWNAEGKPRGGATLFSGKNCALFSIRRKPLRYPHRLRRAVAYLR
jgi:hypothetical protein